MTTPKVSVIVPVYNTEQYLKRCIDSILAQTLQEIEIVIVDDGSKEPCARFCDEIAKGDPRIKVIHKENGGAGFARNSGMEVSSGEYLGFVDSDDYIEPEMYETLYAAAVKHDADLVISGICFVDGNTFEKAGEHRSRSLFAEETVFEGEGMKELLLGVVGARPEEAEDSRYGTSVWKNIFRNSLRKEKGIAFLSEREVLSEDTLFMVDFTRSARKAVGIPGAYYCYRRNETSISKSYSSTRFEKSLVLLDELEKHMEGVLKKEEYQLYLDRLTQGYGRVLCSQEIMHAKEENIAYSVLRKRLKSICTSSRIKETLKTYPWHRLPRKQAAFAFAMKYELFFLQKMMVLLRAR